MTRVRFSFVILAALLASCKAKPEPAPPLTAPVILDDRYEDARAQATQEGKLLFVDAWATWCHSCVAFRANVLAQPALGALSPRFVFASVDTEKPSSAAFLQTHAMNVYPTLFVEDPKTGATLLRWEGTATAAELGTLLDAVLTPNDPGANAFAEAAHARGAGDAAPAKVGFERARVETQSAALRALATEALVQMLYAEKAWDACLRLATRTDLAKLPVCTSKAALLTTSLSCAQEGSLDASALLDAAEAFVISDAARALAVDDRSSLFQIIHALRTDRKETDRAKALAAIWSKDLDAAAAAAPAPELAMPYDAHRLTAYLALDRPERAVQLFEIRTGQYPQDYNAWTRLARAYVAAKRFDMAAVAVGKAEANVYGPRALQVSILKAQILAALGRREEAHATLDAALARGSELGLAVSDDRLAAVRKARETIQ
jgi:tetratricopeptide (TPR) repeat protein